MWYGLNRDALLQGMAKTTCSDDSYADCTGNPFGITPWLPYFVQRNAGFDITKMISEQYDALFRTSVLQYQDAIGSASTDLSAFHAAGGKMISFHGLADPAIFPNGTRQDYQSVRLFDDHIQNYYRYFEAPGIGHCGSPETQSFYPSNTMEALVQWVEHGQASAELIATSQHRLGKTRPLCPYPQKQRYVGGDADEHISFPCL